MNKETLTVEKDEDGTIIYRNADGQRHNPNGPAVVKYDGYKAYYINGKLHNPNGPAIVDTDGIKYHYINGQLHNENGPAIVWADGSKFYWINSKPLTEAEFKTWQTQQSAPLHNETLTIHGIKYKLTAI
jgi:hypothetical protein